MKDKKLLTVIIATYNSENTLPLVLHALKKQSVWNLINVLVVDGGSKDATLEIAKKFECIVIKNPRTEPIYAKFIAYKYANTQYIMYLDHDEVLMSAKSIENKINVMQHNPTIKMVIGSGYRNPDGYPFINEYINEFGDPFSFFIYRLSKKHTFFIDQMKKRYCLEKEDEKTALFSFTTNDVLPLIELVAGGSVFDAMYMKSIYPDTLKKIELIPHFFYLLLSKKPFLGINKHDDIFHYSSDTVTKYTKKIQWRIKNNIFHNDMGLSGFTGRNLYQPRTMQIKKFLYIPYVFSFVVLIIDTLWLIFTRKDVRYILHIPLSIYTAFFIVYFLVLKTLGYRPKLKNYDESKIVNTNNTVFVQ